MYIKLYEEKLNMEYYPPGNHRANKAERAIQDAKNTTIAMLASTPAEFPYDLWDESHT